MGAGLASTNLLRAVTHHAVIPFETCSHMFFLCDTCVGLSILNARPYRYVMHLYLNLDMHQGTTEVYYNNRKAARCGILMRLLRLPTCSHENNAYGMLLDYCLTGWYVI